MTEIFRARQPTMSDFRSRYPVKYGPKNGNPMTLAEILRQVADAADRAETIALSSGISANYEKVGEILDREFLFGAWGAAWSELDERMALELLANLRGAILGAYRVGRERGEGR
jgi:hypothetical protein